MKLSAVLMRTCIFRTTTQSVISKINVLISLVRLSSFQVIYFLSVHPEQGSPLCCSSCPVKFSVHQPQFCSISIKL